MTSTTKVSSAVTGNLLGVLFVGLKLGGVITWPWIWVLAPFWGPLALVGVVLLLALVIAAFASLVGGRR